MPFTFFTAAFLSVVTVLFFCLPKPVRPYLLLTASLYYLLTLDFRSFVALAISAVFVWLAGLIAGRLARSSRRAAQIFSAVCIVLLVAFLLLFKYGARFVPALSLSEAQADRVLTGLLLPIGFSYYVFQAIGYLADVCAGKLSAEKNPLLLALLLCFFPKFVSGPIERAQTLLPQLRALPQVRFFDGARLSAAFAWILYGYFLKTVVADRIGLYVPALFEGYSSHGSPMLFFGSFLYTMQIYCDFAGYSALAVGVAKIYGVELVRNFDAPYLADRISVFWHRWHRSLSQWLRDYVYIPLGGNRRGLLRQCGNTAIVFLLCGMWHGNGLNFVVWGGLHAVYSIVDILLRRQNRDRTPARALRRFIGRLVTFCAVSFAWIFFGASGLHSALGYVARMFTAGNAGTTFAEEMARIDMSVPDRNFLLVGILLVFLMDLASYRRARPFPELVQAVPYGLRYFLYALAVVLILLFGVYGPGYDAGAFLYMAF